MRSLLAERCCVCGVMERAQHAGNVSERRCLDPPFAHGPTRIAFEIDDHKVFASEQDLTKVQIAVATDAVGLKNIVGQFAEFSDEHILLLQELIGACLRTFAQLITPNAEQVESCARLVSHRLIQTTLIEAAEWFRHEGRSVAGICECQVKFANALAEQFGQVQISANRFLRERRRFSSR